MGLSRRHVAVWLSVLAAAASASALALGRDVQENTAISAAAPGDTVAGSVSGDRTAHHSVLLRGGQFTTIVVAHGNIDVSVRATYPDTSGWVSISSDGPDGDVRLPVYANKTERLLVDIAATYPLSPAGTYTLRIDDPRAATETDRQVADAQRHQSEAVRLRERDRYAAAVSEAEAALALQEQARGADAVDVARSLLLVGALENARAHFGAADRLYSRARAIIQRTSTRHELLDAELLDAIAASLIARGRFGDAEPVAREALAVRERVAGPAHFLVAASLGTLADLYHESARPQEAREEAERALDMAGQWYRPEDVRFGDFLNRVARSALAMGNYSRAEQLYRQSLDVRDTLAGADSLAAAASLGGLARVSLLSNDNVPAEQRHLRVLAMTDRVLGSEHPEVANYLTNLGLISYRRRDFPTALARYRRALDIREKIFGKAHTGIAVVLNNIGLVYWQQQDYGRAEEFFGRALTMYEQLFGPDSLRVTSALANLGIIAKETGDYALAEVRYRRALAIRERHLGADHPDLVTLVESLAILARDRGEYQQAEQLFQRTISLTEGSLGPEHPFVARHLANLSQLYWAAGDFERAVAARVRVAAIEERNLPLELAVGSERQMLAYFEPLLSDLSETITLHVRQPRENPAARDLALTLLLQRKGRIFDALADNISAFRSRASADDRALLDEWSRVTASLAAATLGESTRDSAAERQRRIAKLGEQRERLEAAIQRRSAGYLSPSRPLTLAEVQEALPADAALIEFARYTPFDPGASVESDEQLGPPRYVAYVLGHRGRAQWTDLGAAQAIDEAVERFRAALADPSRREIVQRSTELQRLLIAPLQPFVDDAWHLLVSPDGPLNLIPFEALRGASGRYLVEDHLVSYVTTGRDLVRMRTRRPAGGRAVVFADPAFGERAASGQGTPHASRPRGAASPMSFARLAGTASEAQRILRVIPDARLLSGIDATETALKALRRPRLLHIATHGFFLQDQNPGTPGSATDADRPWYASTTTGNPLLRSGLALTGANLSGTGSDDGILTALEASNLDLWGTALVTLSACDTGIGVVRDGEGVFGLRRAFFLAGAQSLVMSLWPVSDLITRDLMAGYYDGLMKGLGRGAALRRVQLEILKRPGRAHPYYWASFIQAGDWRSLDGAR